jgi:hypothetical protein
MDMLMAAIMLFVPVLILLRKLTGVEALIFQLSSGIPRFVVGFACALFVYITLARCSTMVLRHPCVYEVPGGFFVLPAMLLVLLLMPLGFIQIIGALLRKIRSA